MAGRLLLSNRQDKLVDLTGDLLQKRRGWKSGMHFQYQHTTKPVIMVRWIE
jgi:hypothetical protein